jgi:hypothetical protein
MKSYLVISMALIASQGAWHLAGAEEPEFAKLPYKTRALVQAGSGNLLPSPGFAAGLKGWEPSGDVTLVEAEGEHCLRFGPKKDKETARIRVYIPNPKGSTAYVLRFDIKMKPDLELDWEADYQGISGWLCPAVSGKSSVGAIALRETRRSEEWLRREFRLFSPPKTNTLYILMGFSAIKGEALTRRWELVEEPIAASEGRVVLETASGEWAESPHEPQPPAPSEPKVWVASDPDGLSRTSHPTPEDLARPLEMAGVLGETCVAAVGLCTPRDLRGVTLSFSRLGGSAGELGAQPSWKWVVFHPRRTEYYGRGWTFHYLPDFFVERPNGVNCPASETAGFWISLRLPKDARPGLYEGKLSVHAEGLNLALPIKARVFPFSLANLPDRTRYMSNDGGRWKGMSDEQVLAEIAGLQDHGYQSIMLGGRGPVTVEKGQVTGFRLDDDSLRSIRLALRSRLKGPFLFWAGWLPEPLARQLGVGVKTTEVFADKWPPPLATATVDVLKRMRAEIIKADIADPILVLVDEPGYWKKGSPERLLWDVKVGHEAGWPVFCTSSYPPSDPLGKDLEYHSYSGGRLYLDPRRAALLSDQTRAAGQKLWYYCTGSYSGQVGNMRCNRYLAGFFFYRCDADATESWTFQRPRGNAFDDFLLDVKTGRPQTGQACVTYPNPEHPGCNLDTPQWEGLRQAWYDHRYAETLRQAVAAARERKDPAADQAEKRLADLMAALPWNGEPSLYPDMNNKRLAEIRAAIAEEIVKLMKQ